MSGSLHWNNHSRWYSESEIFKVSRLSWHTIYDSPSSDLRPVTCHRLQNGYTISRLGGEPGFGRYFCKSILAFIADYMYFEPRPHLTGLSTGSQSPLRMCARTKSVPGCFIKEPNVTSSLFQLLRKLTFRVNSTNGLPLQREIIFCIYLVESSYVNLSCLFYLLLAWLFRIAFKMFLFYPHTD